MNSIRFSLDFSNVGHILACCGLLETADRLWRESGWVTGRFEFESASFIIDGTGTMADLIEWLKRTRVKDVVRIEPKSKSRRGKRRKVKIEYNGNGDDPAVIQMENGVEWIIDNWASIGDGRPKIKTFAGQMKAPKVVAFLLECLNELEEVDPKTIFDWSPKRTDAAAFGFDGRKGKSALDIGFSPDKLQMETQIFPAVELFAAIGLQYIRPMPVEKAFELGLWSQPLPVELARAVASLAYTTPGVRRLRFRLMGRKERSGVSNAQNDQYQTFTEAIERV